MLTFELRVKLPHGGQQTIVVSSTSRKNAEAAAEAQTGGKVQGAGRPTASRPAVVTR